MSGRRYPPAYLRYLKARLWNLARPSFWGTAIFLAVMGLTVREYWIHPDFLNFRQNKQIKANKPVNSSLSEEDKAIAADIDNLPVLFYDFTYGTLSSSSTATNVKQKTKVDNSNSILDGLSKQKTTATDANSDSGLKLVNPASTPKLENPFVVQTENLLQFKNDYNNGQLLGVNGLTASSMPTGTVQTSTNVGIGFTNPVNYNHNTTLVSPLQTALNQSTNQSWSLGSRTTSTQTNSLLLPNQNLPSTTGLNTNAIAPVNHSTNYPNQNFAPPAANIPNLATTNVQLPTSVVTSITSTQSPNITPSYTQIPSQSVVNSSNFGDASSLQQPTQAPQNNSSSPSQFPGLYTGERQINGISYPK